ncbi:hypothetical protein E2C01_099701 [Portunus trituberculatus]|uniref:Uncharacterized protein n=1 Tax=Portunus trituberculatus TaxID=210409 RepID=A0A5B7K667_PORTR|nr:hypothetical protein [Portunus trituberculatus]
MHPPLPVTMIEIATVRLWPPSPSLPPE